MLGKDALEDGSPDQQEICPPAAEIRYSQNEAKTSAEGGCALVAEQPVIQPRDGLSRTQCNLNSA